MTRGARAFCLAAMIIGAARGAARAEREETPGLVAERDALIEKIARGVDYDASVARFRALVGERDKVVPTSAAALGAVEAAERARRDFLEAYEKTADYDVGERCQLSPDPAHPTTLTERLTQPEWPADWGPVTRRDLVRRPGKTALDPEETITMFEVRGRARSYRFPGKGLGHARDTDFDAAVGELVLVCVGREDDGVVTRGMAVRLAGPPLITKKARWAPFHVLNARFFYDVITDVKYPVPDGAFIVSNVQIAKDLGGGRYEIELVFRDHHRWVLEVPPSVKGRELLTVGHVVWAVMGHQRFDRALRRLVLVAEDLEARYIEEKEKQP